MKLTPFALCVFGTRIYKLKYLADVCNYGGRGANPKRGILHGAPSSLRLGLILGFLSPLFLLLPRHAGAAGCSSIG